MSVKNIERAYRLAQERYAALGVNTDKALKQLAGIPISLHVWQGDDCGGFENLGMGLTGGIAATGNYPGKARTPEELRSDLELAYSLLPCKRRLNLHAFYAETGGKKVDRDEVAPEHFSRWIDWAKAHKIGLDFNPTLFSHPMSASGFTLSSHDSAVRKFWIRHCQACRKIGEAMGRQLGTPCVTNIWIPDGYKDIPVDRLTPRQHLADALDAIFRDKISPQYNLDAIEPKLFGIGAESYTTGSTEFYLGYAVKHGKVLTLDSGHFHPTETIADKISSVMLFVPRLLLHVSRGVRWDSDHVVILSDDLRAIAEELVRGNFLDRTHVGLDYFDASINRVAAWVIGTRCMIKALLIALLEPTDRLRQLERDGDYTARLALLEELKTLPFGAVYDYYCAKQGVPVGDAWLEKTRSYEQKVLARRV
mgnify:CR=1 FL=1